MKFDHNNISPLDSRYANKISNFRENFSESALIKIRFEIEIEWILFLCNKLPKTFKPLSKTSIEKKDCRQIVKKLVDPEFRIVS